MYTRASLRVLFNLSVQQLSVIKKIAYAVFTPTSGGLYPNSGHDLE